LLKRLDQSVQKQPVETTIGEANAILVSSKKAFMGPPVWSDTWKLTPSTPFSATPKHPICRDIKGEALA
jgi:hypothetical protein